MLVAIPHSDRYQCKTLILKYSQSGALNLMCGFVGLLDVRGHRLAQRSLLVEMTQVLSHRGPDSDGYFADGSLGLGFRRLRLIDLESGDQPLFNEDESIVLMCNGEIYNYVELRDLLTKKGHAFRTKSDVEVLLHLYEEEGVHFLNKLNGQFAIVIYDRKKRRLFLARDHVGINPLFYTIADGLLIFASEIKAILKNPIVAREVDLAGLDQVLCFPGLISPTTMFKGIHNLRRGHYITAMDSHMEVQEYWDLDYPEKDEIVYDKPECYYVESLRDLLTKSVKYRLQADVPVGFYLSGGLDSSLIAAVIKSVCPDTKRHSFSIGFNDEQIDERKYQRTMASAVGSFHHEVIFDWTDIAEGLSRAVYHSECPLKETYNTASLALSQCSKSNGISVVLTGEGCDELFAGYIGYRFDQARASNVKRSDLATILEDDLREKLWGDKDLFYEKDYHGFRQIKGALYSSGVNEVLDESDCLDFHLVNKNRLRGRHMLHQRSYLDFQLRLSDHLISDHGDRMAMANSVEARYPFLDINLVQFARLIPPELKLNRMTEKYIIKGVAEGIVPSNIIRRQKFAFVAPGSPYLLRQNIEWINDLLSFERIKKEGYFNPQVIETLKAQYSSEDFELDVPFESDLLIVVITFGLFLELFSMPRLN